MKFNSLSVFLSLLIITVLPFTAYAELTSDESGSPAVSDNYPPYELATPTQADQGHIATTAYVKGAYNDAITAVNTLNDAVYGDLDDLSAEVGGKQDQLYITGENNSVTGIGSEVATEVGRVDKLITARAVDTAFGTLDYKIDGRGVEIYTTWGGNNTIKVRTVDARF